ncbi:hypothetical protein GCM10011491_38510 [Brucella endophytica]|uniref:Uncharacterized protein n=1 Tax=Brucella endophytica TaxID=1963359 RepID=A0A916SP48_9HYPH|nr:hypothetical protein GCM10011491_38510 [Brucella endophytica]
MVAAGPALEERTGQHDNDQQGKEDESSDLPIDGPETQKHAQSPIPPSGSPKAFVPWWPRLRREMNVKFYYGSCRAVGFVRFVTKLNITTRAGWSVRGK